MKGWGWAGVAAALWASVASAQTPKSGYFADQIVNSPEATTPFGASDAVPIIQQVNGVNTIRRWTPTGSGQAMLDDAVNAVLPATLDHLGLGTLNTPAFAGLSLGGATLGTHALAVTGLTFFAPPMSTLNQIGEYFVPTIGLTTDNTVFLTLHNASFGTSISPIPSGTKGMPSVYEGNIFSNQAAVDVTDTGHVFGCTITMAGGAVFNCIDGALTVQTVSPSGDPVAFAASTITRNISGGTVYGVNMNSNGAVGGDIAYHCANTSGQPWGMCFGDQGQSSAAENNSFHGLSLFGDDTLVQPAIIVGNAGGTGVIGTFSNHDLAIRAHNIDAIVINKTTAESTFFGVAVPGTDNTYQLGDVSARWSAIYGNNIFATALVATQSSPPSSDPCTPGRIVGDATYLYECMTSGHWGRVALTGGY